jgi:hypothetical protein
MDNLIALRRRGWFNVMRAMWSATVMSTVALELAMKTPH